MNLVKCIVLCITLLGYIQFVELSRILGFFTSTSKSHIIIHMAVIQTLIDKGHDVTVVTTIPLDNTTNFRHIKLEQPLLTKETRKAVMKPPNNAFENFYRILNFTTILTDRTNKTLHDPQIKKLMKTETFDLVVLGYFFNDFLLGLGAHFKCPIVISYMVQPKNMVGKFVGLPAEPFYVPHIFAGLTQPLGFMDRIRNFLFHCFDIIFSYIHYRRVVIFYEWNFPPDKYPSFDEVSRNVSLILVNHHFSQGPVRPLVPGLIEIGGIQMKTKSNRLSNDVQIFLDNATPHGAIYFSLGSNLLGAELDQVKISAIYKVFSRLKQKVLWKWEDDKTPGNSSNILFKKWFSQDDILAQPNIKLFITHGGAGSILESQYHGVPMVVMPFFGDQLTNAKIIETSGFGVSLEFPDVTEDSFHIAINTVLQNFTYRENVQRFSRIFRDRPMSPQETAAYWLEYVIRHKGAKHIQSPAVNLNGIQYYGLDVIGSILVALYILYNILSFILKKTCCTFIKFLCKTKKKFKKN